MKIQGTGWLAGLVAGLLILSCPVFAANTITYTYDTMNRLTMVQYDNGATVVYTYDKMGNRLTMEVTPPTQAPSLTLAPLTTPSDATVQEVTVPSSSPTAGSAAAGAGGSLPGLQVYLEQLPQVSSVANADQLRQQVFDYLDRSSLSPKDKAAYKKQFSRSLEQQLESLPPQAEAGAPPAGEKPAPAAAAVPPEKAAKHQAPVKKNKIRVDHGKIYTLPPGKDEKGRTSG